MSPTEVRSCWRQLEVSAGSSAAGMRPSNLEPSTNSAACKSLLSLQQLLQPDRQLADALACCMEDRVGDRSSCADVAKLANAFDTGGIDPSVLFGNKNDL